MGRTTYNADVFTISDRLYTADGARQLDRAAIETFGIAGYDLMCRAGDAVVEVARARWPSHNAWLILCGAGNNGGDGYVIARLAHQFGVEVHVVALSDPAGLRGDAATAAQAWLASGGTIERWPQTIPDHVNLVVDAMLGTGLDRAVEGAYRDAIEQVNALACPCVAVDIPSGLHGDSGAVMGSAVKADATVTFIGKKTGLFTAEGPNCSGAVHFARLDVPTEVYATGPAAGHLLGRDFLQRTLTSRSRNSHKGSFGHVLVVAGQEGMSGAARLAGEGALRAGAGLVSVATAQAHANLLNLSRPELMVHAVDDAAALAVAAERATVLALGPGLGCGDWGRTLLTWALADPRPLVLDADGLNLLAEGAPDAPGATREDWIMTPHPAEAARLLGVDTQTVQADRVRAATELARRYQACVVLKGSGSVIAEPGGQWDICALGNPGMATGGSGDVLTGVVAAFRAQGFDGWTAARLATVAHAAAGDEAAREGERGLLALDIAQALRAVIND